MLMVSLQGRVVSGRLRDDRSITLSLCQRNAAGTPERRLGQQHLTDAELEFEAEAEEFQDVAEG